MNLYFPKKVIFHFLIDLGIHEPLLNPLWDIVPRVNTNDLLKKVLRWEHNCIDDGFLIFKFYLSVDRETQLIRFENRLSNPLTYWKLSDNDIHARKKWAVFTKYKEQMFEYTSSKKSPWIVVNANTKKQARLTSMLYLVRSFGRRKFEPLTGEDVIVTHSISVGGVKFRGLTLQQMAVLK